MESIRDEIDLMVYQIEKENLCLVVIEKNQNTEELNTKILGFGWEYNLWDYVMERAGDCEFGELLIRGEQVTTEDYIAIARESFNNLEPFSELISKFKIKTTFEYDKEKEVSKYYQEMMMQFDLVVDHGNIITGEKLILSTEDLSVYPLETDGFKIQIELSK